MADRESETLRQVEKRMDKGKDQMQMAYIYDYVVMNDDLESSVIPFGNPVSRCATFSPVFHQW